MRNRETVDVKQAIRIVVTGLLMGAAEIVPGVSGGTIAFVSGLYERLVNGIQGFTPRRLFRAVISAGAGGGQFRGQALWQSLDLTFLGLLFVSMGIAVLSLARGVSYLLAAQPIMIWSFFFGLVVTSVWLISRQLDLLQIRTLLAVAAGVFGGVILSQLVPVAVHASPLVLMIGGCIAVCAWILPGVSGSYILLLLGLYQTVITAVKELELLSLASLALGCVVGILSVSQLLASLLAKYRNHTLAVLTGIMLGSLPRVWPWKQTVSYQIKSDGSQLPIVQHLILPDQFQELTGQPPELLIAVVACLAGCLVILALDRLALLDTD